jgi:hypothetical protein
MFVADRACNVQGDSNSGQAGQVLDVGAMHKKRRTQSAFCALSRESLCLTAELSQGGICLVWPKIAGSLETMQPR